MKKYLLFFAVIFVALVMASCSIIQENNDPVIGIWSKTANTQVQKLKKEWIFNDAYLGRYHVYSGNNVTFLTDFKWKLKGDTYIISYPGTDMYNDIVKIKTKSKTAGKVETLANTNIFYVLEETSGRILATRE